jgi:hypothetical protein
MNNPVGNLDTGIYIRAQIDGKWESIDIGDARTPAPVVLRWLAGFSDDAILRTMDRVKASMGVRNDDQV